MAGQVIVKNIILFWYCQTQILSSRHDATVLDTIKADLQNIAKVVKDAKARRSNENKRKKFKEAKSLVQFRSTDEGMEDNAENFGGEENSPNTSQVREDQTSSPSPAKQQSHGYVSRTPSYRYPLHKHLTMISEVLQKMIRLCINLCSDGMETPNRQNQHLLREHKVEEVVIAVFKLLRDSKDESHHSLMEEISLFFQTYCMENGDNQAIMAAHIMEDLKTFLDGEPWVGEARAIRAIYEDNINLCASVSDRLIQRLVQRVFPKNSEPQHDSVAEYLICLQTVVCPKQCIVRRNQESVVYQVTANTLTRPIARSRYVVSYCCFSFRHLVGLFVAGHLPRRAGQLPRVHESGAEP